jgi:hypothetical protein
VPIIPYLMPLFFRKAGYRQYVVVKINRSFLPVVLLTGWLIDGLSCPAV